MLNINFFCNIQPEQTCQQFDLTNVVKNNTLVYSEVRTHYHLYPQHILATQACIYLWH